MEEIKNYREIKKESFYATALLSDGKILFWRINPSPKNIYDFYKDFYYAGINQDEYFENHKITTETMGFEYVDSDDELGIKKNRLVFKFMAKAFFKLFPISEDAKGESPY